MADNDDVRCLRDAVELVLHDARLSLNSDAVSVTFQGDDLPEELGYLTDPGHPSAGAYADAYAYVKGEPGLILFAFGPFLRGQELLLHVADNLQELAIESRQFLGRAFHPAGSIPAARHSGLNS